MIILSLKIYCYHCNKVCKCYRNKVWRYSIQYLKVVRFMLFKQLHIHACIASCIIPMKTNSIDKNDLISLKNVINIM